MAVCKFCRKKVKNNANKRTLKGTNTQVHKKCPK